MKHDNSAELLKSLYINDCWWLYTFKCHVKSHEDFQHAMFSSLCIFDKMLLLEPLKEAFKLQPLAPLHCEYTTVQSLVAADTSWVYMQGCSRG